MHLLGIGKSTDSNWKLRDISKDVTGGTLFEFQIHTSVGQLYPDLKLVDSLNLINEESSRFHLASLCQALEMKSPFDERKLAEVRPDILIVSEGYKNGVNASLLLRHVSTLLYQWTALEGETKLDLENIPALPFDSLSGEITISGDSYWKMKLRQTEKNWNSLPANMRQQPVSVLFFNSTENDFMLAKAKVFKLLDRLKCEGKSPLLMAGPVLLSYVPFRNIFEEIHGMKKEIHGMKIQQDSINKEIHGMKIQQDSMNKEIHGMKGQLDTIIEMLCRPKT